MKYKLLKVNIISYIILYHILFESILTIYDFDESSRLSTPLGRVIRYFVFNQKYYGIFSDSDFYILFFNLFVFSILFYFVYKWYGNEKLLITLLKLIGIFIVINFLIIIYVIIDYSFATTFIYIFYFLIPMSTMFLLMIPIFWLNKKIFGDIIINTKNENH